MRTKYLIIFITITYGLCWGLAGISMIFSDFFSKFLGEISFTNPLVVVALYSPNIAAVVIYGIMGGKKAIINLLKKLIPRKKDCYWFAIIFGMALLYALTLRFGSILMGLEVPEMTFTPFKIVKEIFINFFEEAGIFGGVFGWIGFLLPYFQKKFSNNVKAGFCTGLLFGIYVLPAYAISSFELVALYPLYIIQMVFFCIFVSYMFNFTNGNLLFYIVLFWLISSGSRLQIYYFNAYTQMIQSGFFIVSVIIISLIVNKKKINQQLYTLPEYGDIKAV